MITEGRVCFIACRLVRSDMKTSIRLKLGADTQTNRAARGTTSGGCRNRRNTVSAGMQSTVTASPVPIASTIPRWMPSAAASWSRAPIACETMGSIPQTMPIPNMASA